MFKRYLHVVAIVLSISIFNMINFKRAMDIRYGRGSMNIRKLRTILCFGFCRPIHFWFLDFYCCMKDPDFIIKMICKQSEQSDLLLYIC